tara:strand:- start:190 stop:960 length:771 start_codon:yes stop_codon:yes gene_type:complete
MFDLFKSKKDPRPLDYDLRKFFENNWLCLMHAFPEPDIKDRKIRVPEPSDFPIKWQNSKENAQDVLAIVAPQMEIDPALIELEFYKNNPRELDSGISSIFLESDPDSSEAAGMYFHEKVDGKFQIALDEALLQNPENLIATLSHELAHVKLLGENVMEEADEMTTDMTTVYFGMGIFNANAAFRFYQEMDRWGYNSLGYLKIEEWAYVLALLAFTREEDNPEWENYLSKDVYSEFDCCLTYMLENEEEIFHFEEAD